MAKRNLSHSHLHPAEFGQKMSRDPGAQEKPQFGDANSTKTMKIDKARLPQAPKRHPHRKHAGARTKRAIRTSSRAK